MKKFTLSILVSLISAVVFGQSGLERVYVEKYYVSDANDSIAADAVSLSGNGTLPSGSVTWRIYADLLPGYYFLTAYGSPTHELRIETTTSFYNNGDRGATTPTYTKSQARGNTIMLDSWLSSGAACAGNFGILKSLDNGVSNVVNSDVVLQNNDISAGIPLTTQDGLIIEGSRTPGSVTFVGPSFTPQLSILGDGSVVGNSIVTTQGAWSCNEGGKGPDTLDNKVLIAQLTTKGTLTFQLNIEIRDSIFNDQFFVANSPLGDEIQEPTLIFSGTPVSVPNATKVDTYSSFTVFPNPSADKVTLEIKSSTQSNSNGYTIYDNNGRIVTKKKIGKVSGTYTENIDISSLACGEYFVELSLDGIASVKKIVKN